MFELDNKQRAYFGLEPVLDSWDKILFKGDAYRADSFLYFEGDTIKKQVVSTDSEYKEIQFNEQTNNRTLILPKTKKGRPKKLTPSVLESRKPLGVYLYVSSAGDLIIGNYSTQTTFYSRDWEYRKSDSEVKKMISAFIKGSSTRHLAQIKAFSHAKRKQVKYQSGDFFSFKLNRTEYGFGRILFDVQKARKRKFLPDNHGLNLLMGQPLLIKLYAYKLDSRVVDLAFLSSQKSLPADYIMDNVVFYGEFELLGNLPLEINEFDFPISFGARLDQTPNVFIQWGLIHRELPRKKFNMYVTAEHNGREEHNPYGYYGLGFRPNFDTFDVQETITNNGVYDFDKGTYYKLKWDLRNPRNEKIRAEILEAFGLDPTKSYEENCRITGTKDIVELIKEMK